MSVTEAQALSDPLMITHRGSPNDNSRGTSGVHIRPDAVYTLYE